MRSVFHGVTVGLPSAFWYLWFGTLVNRVGSFVLIFLAIYLTHDLGFSDTQAGLVIGLWGAGGALGSIVGGVLADRWGRRTTLLSSQLMSATMMVGLGLSQQLWLMCCCALVLGLFAEAARPAYSAMVIDVVSERDRMRALSLNYWAHNLGFGCSAILVGIAAGTDHLTLFVIDAATTIVFAVIVAVKVAETRVLGTARSGNERIHPGLGAVVRDRVYLWLILINLVVTLVFLQHKSMLPIAMSDDGLSTSAYGWVVSLNGILIVVGQLLVLRLVQNRDQSTVMTLGTLVLGFGFTLTAFASEVWFYAITVLIWTLGEMLMSPPTATMVAALSPKNMHGRYQGVFALSSSVATFAAPVLGGLVRDAFGNTALWLGAGALAFIAGAQHLASRTVRIRRIATLATTTPHDSPESL